MNEQITITEIVIKSLIINIFIYITIFKINGEKINVKFVIVSCIIQTLLYTCVKEKVHSNDNFIAIVLSCLMQIIIMKIYTKNIKRSVISSVFIADALVYTLFIICLAVEFLLKIWINIENQTFDLILTLLIEALFLGGILKIKKIKNGISFLQNPIENEYLCIIMVAISVIAVFAYSLFGSSDEYLGSNIFIVIITSLILIIVMIQKTLTLYYKQKLLAQNIEEYKAEIASKDAEIKSLSEEKYKISKLNHEFYNRQKALIHKVEEIMNMNTETAEELDLSKQINDLTKEYTDKAKEIKTLDKLPITGITE